VANAIDNHAQWTYLRHKVAQATFRVWQLLAVSHSSASNTTPSIAPKGGSHMEWVSPDFEEVETSAEVTAYVGHW